MYDQYMVDGVLPKWLEEFKRCEQWVQDALEYAHGTHTVEDVAYAIARGDLQFWAGEKSVMITQIINYPRAKMAHCFLAGGDINDIEKLEVGIAAWARGLGCTRLSLTGRAGWSRSFLKDIGYDSPQINMIKEI